MPKGSLSSLKVGLGLTAFLSLVGCDHATKHVAKSALEGQSALALVSGVLDLTYTENPGIAFSLLNGIPHDVGRPLLASLGFIAVFGLAIVAWRSGWKTSTDVAAFALLGAGAVGNQLDRVLRGYVVDFIHLHHWPVFNVADVLIVVGYALFFWARWRHGRKPPATAGPALS
jgi:signal peptidase II